MMLSIIEQGFIALPLLLGAYLIFSLLKLPDLSLESSYLFGAVVAYFAKELPFPLVLLSAMMGGVCVGATVSIFNQFLRIPCLLAAIITNGLFHGFIVYLIGGGFLSFHYQLPMQELLCLFLVSLALLCSMGIFLRSQIGYSFAIYGNNSCFFRNHPISERYVVVTGVIVGHAFAAISGFFFTQSNGFIDITIHFGVVLMCLTALMIGKLLIRSVSPNILLPLVGIVIYFFLQQGLLRLGLNLKYFNTFQALCVLGALLMSKRKNNLSLDHLGV